MADGNGHSDSNAEQFRHSIRLLHQGRYEEAAHLLEALYQSEPDNAEYALNLGGAYIMQRRYAEAEEILERAAKEAPDNANVWVNLAAARLGPLEESSEAQQNHAIAAYEQALAANPEVANVHYMLGLIYRSRKDNLRAIAHFTRALEQNPQDNDARRMLSAIASEVAGKNKEDS
jgi:tetratricopeptide (TPR) repeat protein